MLVVINPVAGGGRSLSLLPGLIKTLSESGHVCTVVTTTGRGSASDYVKKLGRGSDTVVCAGGDGTANEVISGLMQIDEAHRPKFGYIPCGSTNDFAVALGIPKKPRENIATIIRGSSVPIDVGSFNGRYFASVCAFGAFTNVSFSTSQTAKNLFGMLAYLAKGMELLRELRPIRARFVINGEQIEDDFCFCAISNSRVLGGVLRIKDELVELNDGLFEIILIRYAEDALGFSKIIAAIANGGLECEHIRVFHANTVEVTMADDEPVDFSLDGECEKGVRSARIVNIRSGIRVITDGEK
ncbi:MAG: diacylglycerol kinase family lipid kinase [Clostridia bacterium]|nr:diacylglycerol kinase family lipid kinase [Clostridia bacterium]